MYDRNYNLKKVKKKTTTDYFCPCCRSARTLRYSRRLSLAHFTQIFILTLGFTAATYPWLDWKGAISLPIIWAIFESVHSSLYRKDLSCLYCGFDVTWYKKDVKMARQKVEEFLKQNPDTHVLRRTKNSENIPTNLN